MKPDDPLMSQEFASWRDFPAALWRWRNFSPAELACRGDGKLRIHPPSLDLLQTLRDRLGEPMIVQSAYRTVSYNSRVGGAPQSKHLQARAFDIAMGGHDPHAFEALAREVGFTGFGYYPDQGFMHIDTGPSRSWGEPFPRHAAPDQVEATSGPTYRASHPLKRKRA